MPFCHLFLLLISICITVAIHTIVIQLFPDASQALGRIASVHFACRLRPLRRHLAVLGRVLALMGILTGGPACCIVFPVPGFLLLL